MNLKDVYMIFGKIITHKIIKPIILKYCNVKLKNIKPHTIDKFALGRYVIASNQKTVRLKKRINLMTK